MCGNSVYLWQELDAAFAQRFREAEVGGLEAEARRTRLYGSRRSTHTRVSADRR
ncbi:MAG: hypothetical protein HYX52_00355 [Chloroflexi bacterium]|nr:hypothetical protein [Chloroflexota bacterium]